MKAPKELYNDETETYLVNPAALAKWPEPLAELTITNEKESHRRSV